MVSESERLAGAEQRGAEVHRLILVVSAVVFLDTLFYAVIAPLLPALTHELRLSKLSAGILTAAYPFGVLLASIPGGVLAVRAGPRFTVCTGLALFACSTVGFGLLHSAVALDLARFVEGIGGACSWAGGLAWIVAETPVERRGAMMGRALAAGIGGALFGPAIGALATGVGRPGVFGAIAVVAVLLIAVTRGLTCQRTSSDQGVSALVRVARTPAVVGAMWLMALPAVVSGIINVLGPLRLHRLGAGAGVIGATFLVAAGVEALISPLIGGLSDRRGRLFPLRAGLAATAVTVVCFTLPASAALFSGLIVLIAATLGGFWAPAMAMLSEAAETRGLDQGLAAALMNLAWAGGQIIGAAGGGAVAKTTGNLLPTAGAGGLCALTLCGLAVRSRRRSAAATGS